MLGWFISLHDPMHTTYANTALNMIWCKLSLIDLTWLTETQGEIKDKYQISSCIVILASWENVTSES